MANTRDHQTRVAYRDLLRLSQADLQAILADLRPRKEVDEEVVVRRQHKRNTYTEEALLLLEIKSQQEETPFLVKCADLSAGGLGLLHGGFVHTGQPCVITLVSRRKAGMRIKGTVARCVHVRGHVHLIGVKFNEAIDETQLAQFELAA
ncbi:MAG: PilZ domain-containing protein [Phycisphaeraceae bacterium]